LRLSRDSSAIAESDPSSLRSPLQATGEHMTFEEMAWEFVEVFDELDVAQINEMLARNVPLKTLEFFSEYAEAFGTSADISEKTLPRLPNLMLIGYLLRVLEERLFEDGEPI
jgi:hypothetical protein